MIDHKPAQARGRPLVFLHGFPSSSFDYHLVLPRLAQDRRVVLVDLPGFGFSDKPERYSYSLFEQADVVEGLLTRLQLEDAHLIAHDLGVSIACELLARRQRKLHALDLASLTLMSAGVYDELARVTPSQKVLQTPLGSFFAGLAVGPVFKLQMQQVFTRAIDGAELDAMWEQILFLDGHKRLSQIASYLGERARFEERWLSALRTCEAPIHLIWGSRDPTARFEIAERLAEEIPGAHLTRLSKVGHYPQLEAPDETAYAIEQWLQQQAAAQVAE
ncbi:MAG TPA: alpha/beta hydrolase [Polyangiales bacterium]|nr:alpha/beta hydrolase [Polyangiales bacterium]